MRSPQAGRGRSSFAAVTSSFDLRHEAFFFKDLKKEKVIGIKGKYLQGLQGCNTWTAMLTDHL